MNTTLMFAELLIVGLQVTAWLFLLILNIFGYSWLEKIPLSIVADWQTALVLVGVSVFYILGVLFDRVADSIFNRWNFKIRKQIFHDLPPTASIGAIRFEVVKDNENLNRYFEYVNTRLRIARSSAINFGIITVLAVIFVLGRLTAVGSNEKVTLVITIMVLGVLVTSVSIFAWYELTRIYFRMVRVTYEKLPSKDDKLVLKTLLAEPPKPNESSSDQQSTPRKISKG